jgi:branched-chain amino acid transport system ATP-binding protein
VDGGRSSPVLVAEHLSVSYGALHALRDVSWSVGAGEILGIIGPNGAGKSTAFEAVCNTVAHSGRVILDGREVTAEPTYRLAPLGLRRTFQQNAFFGGISVLENMTGVLLDTHGTPLLRSVLTPWEEHRRRREAEAAARALLDRFGVAVELQGALPASIPYGTQRMLSIALAYGREARVLLLDEPAAGLGGRDMERLRMLLVGLREEGIAIVLIEHHMDLLMSVADRVVVLDQGQCIAEGPPPAIQADPRVLDAYLGRAA